MDLKRWCWVMLLVGFTVACLIVIRTEIMLVRRELIKIRIILDECGCECEEVYMVDPIDQEIEFCPPSNDLTA